MPQSALSDALGYCFYVLQSVWNATSGGSDSL